MIAGIVCPHGRKCTDCTRTAISKKKIEAVLKEQMRIHFDEISPRIILLEIARDLGVEI